jgi:hypothetical protein
MAASRSSDELCRVRRDLFDHFPRERSAEEAFSYQVRLAAEIRQTEREQAIARDPERKEHLHSVRLYGDALAMTHLSDYAVRQLSRNPGSPAHLSAQAEAFDFTLDSARKLSEGGVPALLVDVTNILKIGDIVACTDPNAPSLLECKSGSLKDIRFERQGRRGRQLARMESVETFLTEGRGVIYSETAERRTVSVATVREFSYDIVNELVLQALDHTPTTKLVQPNELFSAALLGEFGAETEATVRSWDLLRGTKMASGSSLDVITRAWPDVSPPILWGISSPAQWALMEGEVTVIHAVRVEAFLGMRNGEVCVRSVIDTSGPLPWSYEILVENEIVTLSANILRDVVYLHETLASAGQRMLAIAENANSVIREVDVPS